MLCSADLSPFSPQALGERENRGLLVQFLLFELIAARQAVQSGALDRILTPHLRFFPYDWSLKTGYLNKIQEHALFLEKSFPDRARGVKKFRTTLTKTVLSLARQKQVTGEKIEHSLRALYTAMMPLIEACKENENLLLFLLKNRSALDMLNGKGHLAHFLRQIHLSDLETLGEKMCDQYHRRGFFSQIPELKFLLTELLHA